MTDRDTLDRARLLFVGDTQGDKLAREVIAIAEERAQTIACEVEHSRKLEDQLKDLHGMLAPLKDAALFAKPGDTILDPFCGSGTTLYAAKELHRKAIGCDVSAEACALAEKRLAQELLKIGEG